MRLLRAFAVVRLAGSRRAFSATHGVHKPLPALVLARERPAASQQLSLRRFLGNDAPATAAAMGEGSDVAKRVFVLNLPYEATMDEVREFMQDKAGPVKQAEILTTPDGQSKGCAVVEFEDEVSAEKAIAEVSMQEFQGRSVFVRPVGDTQYEERKRVRDEPRPQDQQQKAVFGKQAVQLYVGNIPPTFTWQDLKDLFKPFGAPAHVNICRRPGAPPDEPIWGTLQLENAEAAQRAMNHFSQPGIGSRYGQLDIKPWEERPPQADINDLAVTPGMRRQLMGAEDRNRLDLGQTQGSWQVQGSRPDRLPGTPLPPGNEHVPQGPRAYTPPAPLFGPHEPNAEGAAPTPAAPWGQAPYPGAPAPPAPYGAWPYPPPYGLPPPGFPAQPPSPPGYPPSPIGWGGAPPAGYPTPPPGWPPYAYPPHPQAYPPSHPSSPGTTPPTSGSSPSPNSASASSPDTPASWPAYPTAPIQPEPANTRLPQGSSLSHFPPQPEQGTLAAWENSRRRPPYAPRSVELSSCQVVVKFFPFSTDEEDLVELFSSTGAKVEVVEIVRNEKVRNLGVVQFSSAEEARNAVETFNGYRYGGRGIVVRLANDPFDFSRDAWTASKQQSDEQLFQLQQLGRSEPGQEAEAENEEDRWKPMGEEK